MRRRPTHPITNAVTIIATPISNPAPINIRIIRGYHAEVQRGASHRPRAAPPTRGSRVATSLRTLPTPEGRWHLPKDRSEVDRCESQTADAQSSRCTRYVPGRCRTHLSGADL